MLEWTITAKDSGLKLLSFLTAQLKEKYSARAIKRMIETNNCQVNARTERFASTILGEGDHICLSFSPVLISPSSKIEETQRVLYEDEAILVYNKPAGLNCDEEGILKILKNNRPSLQLVHRLDRDTTGVLILAKQLKVFECFVQQFKQLQVKKNYQAIVDGSVKQPKGIIKNYLGKKQDYAGQTRWGSVSQSQGHYAYTKWQCLKKNKQASWLSCLPETGRTHQIRVHLAEMGHPILGDFQYGKTFKCAYRPSRYLLHAKEITFQHPSTNKQMHIMAALPEDFERTLQQVFTGDVI